MRTTRACMAHQGVVINIDIYWLVDRLAPLVTGEGGSGLKYIGTYYSLYTKGDLSSSPFVDTAPRDAAQRHVESGGEPRASIGGMPDTLVDRETRAAPYFLFYLPPHSLIQPLGLPNPRNEQLCATGARGTA